MRPINYRLLTVYFKSTDDLHRVYRWQYNNRQLFRIYNLRVIFTKARRDGLTLHGYDRKLKWRAPVSALESVFDVIRSMPMGRQEMTTIRQGGETALLELCGLPSGQSTSHCFRDDTHRTCCMLGKEARAYADRTGNPIGTASIRAFREYYGFFPSEDTLTPWCTCIGSKVCTFYSQRFNDGTHIRFIDDMGRSVVIRGDEVRYRRVIHRTPGIF